MIKRGLLLLVLVCSIGGGARAQCCGDCNGDGTVSINELITAVNNALLGCGAATPTPGRGTPTHKPTATPTSAPRCTLSFTNTSGICDFQGTFNRGCGSALNSVLATNGTELTVILATETTPPLVYFAAKVDSATTASLQVWSTDGFQTQNVIAGVVQLNNNATQLEIFPNDPRQSFQILSCPFVQYLGAYTGNTVVSPQELPRAAGETASGLRSPLEPPIPNLGAP